MYIPIGWDAHYNYAKTLQSSASQIMRGVYVLGTHEGPRPYAYWDAIY